MSDIWSVGDSDGGSEGQGPALEDWDCGSESSEEQRPSKRAKKGTNTRPQRVITTLHNSQPKGDDAVDDEDDLMAFLTTTAATPPPAQRGKKGGKGKRSSTVVPVLLDDDDLGLEGAITAAAAAKGRSGTSPDPVRLAALEQRALRDKLAQAQHAADADDDDDEVQVLDSDDDGDLPLPTAGKLIPEEDPTLQLLEELEAEAGTAVTAAAAAAAAADDSKLPLVFQAQAHSSVTVRVQPDQPLSHAMETFTKYAADNGWGKVTKFMFDGEKLTGDDTPEDLQMDADDAIDVYLDS